MTFRLTQALAQRIKPASPDLLPLDPNPFGDWCAREFAVGRARFVMFSNTATMYTVVFEATGITTADALVRDCLHHLGEFMADQGLTHVYEKRILPCFETVSFSKTGDRRVTGSMNELVYAAKYKLAEGSHSPANVSGLLTDFLLSYLGRRGTLQHPYDTPGDAMSELIRSTLSLHPQDHP